MAEEEEKSTTDTELEDHKVKSVSFLPQHFETDCMPGQLSRCLRRHSTTPSSPVSQDCWGYACICDRRWTIISYIHSKGFQDNISARRTSTYARRRCCSIREKFNGIRTSTQISSLDRTPVIHAFFRASSTG